MALASAVLRLAVDPERRRLHERPDGLRLYLDPLSHAGRAILEYGALEPDTESTIADCLRQGDTFVDVGANEGVLSAFAARLVGPSGTVIAVEPQARLTAVAEFNILLNGPVRYEVVEGALGGEIGDACQLNLYPALNTGASGFAGRYRFSRRSQPSTFVSLADVLERMSITSVALLKVDVEGFEGRVVDSLSDLLRSGRIRRALIDYHPRQLCAIGDSPRAVHERLQRCGMFSGNTPTLDGYVLYRTEDCPA